MTEQATATVSNEATASEAIIQPAVKVNETTTSEPKSWFDGLPDELKAEKSLGSFKDVNGLAKSYVELNKVFGKRLEDLTPEQVNTYYAKLGVPEKLEDYGITPESENDVLTPEFVKLAHEAKIPKEAATKVMGWYKEIVANAVAEQAQAKEARFKEEVEAIKKEFGSAYKERVEIVNQAVLKFGGEGLVKALEDAGLTSNPTVVKAFYEAGKLLQEDKIAGDKLARNFGMSPEEAIRELDKFNADNRPHIFDSRSPKHEWAKKRQSELYQLAYPV